MPILDTTTQSIRIIQSYIDFGTEIKNQVRAAQILDDITNIIIEAE